MVDLYIRNGKIITEETTFNGGVTVEDGKIKQLISGNAEIPAKEVIDLNGKFLLPGVIDEHCHWSEPGRDWEGYTTGSMAAAAGGITTAIDMPLNDLPPMISKERFQNKVELTKDKAVIDYAFWGGIIDDNFSDLEGQHQEGVVGFKAFMVTASDYGKVTDGMLYAGLKKMKEMGNLIGVHAENEPVNTYLKKQFIQQGRTDRSIWPESRPPEAELEAIKRAIYWAKASGGRLVVLHISTADGIRAVTQAKMEGADVFAEVCAHYLCFDNNDYLAVGPELRCAPPLRSSENLDELWNLVLNGQIDAIASDHSPCPPEMQDIGYTDIWKAFGGITGNQVLLPAIISEGVHKRGLSWPKLVKLMCSNPARIFGMYPTKGAMVPGADADFAIVDPDKEWVLEASDLFNRHKHSAYVGRTFKGKVIQTIVRGETVFKEGTIIAQPGFGKLVKRKSF